MPFQIISIKQSIRLAHDTGTTVQDLFERKRAKTTENPRQIADGVHQLLSIAQRVDDGEAEDSLSNADFTRLGDYGMQLLTDLNSWLTNNAPGHTQAAVQQVIISLADWTMRHDGQLQTLEPIVDALATLSNQSQSTNELRELSRFMARIINACDETIKNDLEQANPGRPWRILHLNYGITATRTHDTKLIRETFDRLVNTLPQDAAQFFTEGMQEMERLNYPQHVRKVMQEYFQQWARRTVH